MTFFFGCVIIINKVFTQFGAKTRLAASKPRKRKIGAFHKRERDEMKRLDRLTPEGTRDLFFEDFEQVKKIEDTLAALFSESGYRGISTPAIEFYDVFSAGVGAISQQDMYILADSKGRLMALRPDSTKPVARLVSTRLKNQSPPFRLYYCQSVYKRNKGENLLYDEVRQAGIELVGLGGLEGDIEALLLAARSLERTCGKGFLLEIGHMGFFTQIINSTDFPEEVKQDIKDKIEAKNYPALSTLLEKFPKSESVGALLRMPALYGGIEVLDEARRLIRGAADGVLGHIGKVYAALKEHGFEKNLAIDLGLLNGYGYYSGLVLKGYAFGASEAVLSGGRYDYLYGDYGLGYPAIGFAINTEQLLKQREQGARQQGEKRPLFIALTKGRLEKHAIELFKKAGVDCCPLDSKGRKLVIRVRAGEQELDVVFAKAADVITYVEHGACDMGIVGKDTIMEQGKSFYEMLDLGFGRCRLVLAAKKGRNFYGGYGVKTIATKFPKVAAQFFEGKKMNVDIIKIDGSVELTPLLELADGIVDITETGTTLRENGLEVVEEIADISAKLIVNTASLKTKREKLESFISLLKGAMNGRDI